MDDDGGIQWFQTVAEEEEYLAWLDMVNDEFERAMAQPVNAPEKEIENGFFDCF